MQYKQRLVPGFTSKHNLTRLIYYEEYMYVDLAKRREKQLRIGIDNGK